MERVSPIRLDSLEEYEANMEAELMATRAQQVQQSQQTAKPQETNQAQPDRQHHDADPILPAEQHRYDEHTQPLDTVSIRGFIQTIADLRPKAPPTLRYDIKI